MEEIIILSSRIKLQSLVRIDEHSRNKEGTTFIISSPYFVSDDGKYLEDEKILKTGQWRNKYVNLIKSSLSSDLSGDQLNEIVNNIVALEDQLSRIASSPKNKSRIESFEQLTLEELNEKFTGLNLTKVIKDLVGPNLVERVIVWDVEYLNKLNNLLNGGKIDIKTFKYEQIWKINQLQSDDSPNINAVEILNQKKYCFFRVNKFALNLVGRAYIDAIKFSEETKSQVTNLAKKIKSSFKKIIQEKDWLDQETKTELLSKLNNMKINIAYPGWIKNDTEVLHFFKLKSRRDDGLFELLVRLQIHPNIKTLGNINLKYYEWYPFSPATVNAGYVMEENSIIVPAASIKGLLNADLPDYYNFGVIGTFIGHEMTHAFDYSGSKMLKWSTGSWLKFIEKKDRIEKQYNITDDRTGLPLDGTKTLNENIADNGAIREAFYAVFSEQNKELQLPGFENWSKKKIFFLNYANLWCSVESEEVIKSLIKKDSHSLPEQRTNIPLSNFDEFAKAFDCPADSRMNLGEEEAVIIW